ncbi:MULTISPECIES: hypothetical protein [unclassified Rhizobium]|uniref:GumC family protein n=1 Tax=unclassified Rhizobium TaxID=2613769 RepID=UPI001300F85E|nr:MULTISPECIES: hypothetical protein [unclassified Rhizobium]MDM9621954.1 hypothetical protein [Rhizobium sp. S96]
MNYYKSSANIDGNGASRPARLQVFKLKPGYLVGATLAFLSILAMTLIALQLTPAKFRASADLLVLLSDDYVARPTAGSTDTSNAPAMDRDAYMSAESDILGSETVIKAAITSIDPHILYPASTGRSSPVKSAIGYARDFISGVPQDNNDDDEAAMLRARRAVEKSLRIDSGRSGNIITVSYEHYDPELSAQFLSALIDAYFARRAVLFADPQTTLLMQQIKTKSDELQIAKAGLAEFRQRYAISDLNLQRDLLLRHLSDLNNNLRTTDVAIADATARHKTILDQLDASPADRTRRAASGDVATKQGDPADALRKQSDELEQALSADGARRTEMKSRISDLETELRTLNDQEGTLHDLTLRRDILERQYALGLDKLSERKAAEAVREARLSNVRLVDAPEAPQRPTSQRLLIAASGMMLALFSFGAILTLGWLRRPGSQPLRWFA